MERAFLESFGLEKEQIDQILNKASSELGNKLKEKENEYTALNQKYESLKEELTTANGTIDSLKKNNKDNEALQNQINQYKADIEKVKAQAEKDRVEMSINLALTTAGAINPKTVMPLINRDAIVVGKDGSIAGIDEQIQNVLADENNAFLFKRQEEITESPNRGGYAPEGSYTKPVDPSFGGGVESDLGKILGEQRRNEKINNQSKQSVDAFWNGTL